MKKNICFAYYADGKWIGWYGDSSGQVTSCPKLYTNSEEQLEIIKSNLTNKLHKINTSSFDEENKRVTGLAAFSLLSFSSERLLRGKDIELRIIECPEYDGVNPDFDEEEYKTLLGVQNDLMIKEGIFNIPAPSIERTKALEEFYKREGRVECNNWIYADYNKVREWAKIEPTEFIGVIKS